MSEIIMKTCPVCGALFRVPPRRRETAKYCSQKCASMGRRTRYAKVCPECGVTFAAGRGNRRYCSELCRRRAIFRRRVAAGVLPAERVCGECGEKRPIRSFLDETGVLRSRCDLCREEVQQPSVRLYRCRDCGRMTANRFYCPTCLHEREHGGADKVLAA